MADAPDALYRCRELPGDTRMLGALLWRHARHGDAQPFTFAGTRYLAGMIGYDLDDEKEAANGERMVRKHLSRLREAGLIERGRRDGKRGWFLRTQPDRAVRVADSHTEPEPDRAVPLTGPCGPVDDDENRTLGSAGPDRTVLPNRTVGSVKPDPGVRQKPHEAPGKPQRSPSAVDAEVVPLALAPSLPPPSLKAVEAGAFDDAPAHVVMAIGGAMDQVFLDHAAAMGNPGTRMNLHERGATQRQLERGAKVSWFLRGSREVRQGDGWRPRRRTTARKSWGYISDNIFDYATAALVDGDVPTTGPPAREDFNDDDAFEAAKHEYLQRRYDERAAARRA